MIKHIKSLPLHKRMLVDIKEYRKNRTNSQNRLMWKWYGIIGDHVGMKPEEIHECMKARVLGVEEYTLPRFFLGKDQGVPRKLLRPKSSTALNTKEMSEFMNAIEVLARSLDIVLPYPDDYNYAMGRE